MPTSERAAVSAGVPPQGEQPPEQEVSVRDLEALVDPVYLEHLVEASGGFRYHLIKQEDVPAGAMTQVGFTDMKSRRIFLIKEALARFLAVKNGRRKLKGFFAHEGGHHAPDVLKLDHKLRETLGETARDPKEFVDEFALETETEILGDRMPLRQLFWRAVSADAYNGALDVWLEQYMGRDPFASIKRDYQTLHELEDEPRDFLKSMPLHHQLTQWLVGEEQYLNLGKRMTQAGRRRALDQAAQKVLSPEVVKALGELHTQGSIRVLLDVDAWESFGTTSHDQERAIDRKFEAVADYLLPAWIKLLKMSLDQGMTQTFPFVCEREPGEEEDVWKSRMFKEKFEHDKRHLPDRYELLRTLLNDTEQLGKAAYGSATPDPENEGATQDKLDSIKPSAGKGKEEAPARPRPDPDQLRRQRVADLADAFEKGRLGEDADRFGVSEDAVAELRRLENAHQGQISDLAEHLAEAFLSERRAKREYFHAEGQLTSGAEAFAVAEGKRGNQDVRVYEQTHRTSEFTSTDVEVLVDSSGSMQGGRLEIGRALVVVIQKAFERVRELLADELLLRPEDEEPLRIGYAGFTTNPYRIKKLGEPLKEDSLAQLIHQTNTRSGGTDDASAIEALANEFQKGSEAALKFLVIVSDGEGNPDAVQELMDGLERSDEMFVIVVGLGANADAVLNTYAGHATAGGLSNVLPLTGDSVQQIMPELMKYLLAKISSKTSEKS